MLDKRYKISMVPNADQPNLFYTLFDSLTAAQDFFNVLKRSMTAYCISNELLDPDSRSIELVQLGDEEREAIARRYMTYRQLTNPIDPLLVGRWYTPDCTTNRMRSGRTIAGYFTTGNHGPFRPAIGFRAVPSCLQWSWPAHDFGNTAGPILRFQASLNYPRPTPSERVDGVCPDRRAAELASGRRGYNGHKILDLASWQSE